MASSPPLKPGDILENGWHVVAYYELLGDRFSNPGGIVLAAFPGRYTGDPYATWLHVRPPERPGYCVRGNYFRTVIEATQDFAERITT